VPKKLNSLAGIKRFLRQRNEFIGGKGEFFFAKEMDVLLGIKDYFAP
jgi:hypothetical protein